MKTKHLFYTLAVSAAFAACSQEEIVSQQEIASADLSNRPVVGKVALNFGEAESRGTVADRAFNAIDFVKGVDGFGARIIDEYYPNWGNKNHMAVPNGATLDHAWRNYKITDDYASSNYKYVNNGGAEWVTDALMVEGNYMFYYPYNEANLARTPNKVVLPMTQVVKPNEEDGYRNPIKDLYEGENPAIVGYAFLSATDQDATVKPELNHIFAYPQFTIKNEQTETVGTGWWAREEGVDLLIEKIEISSEKFFVKNYEINHSGVEANLRDFALAQQKKGTTVWADKFEAGKWTDATSLLKNAVSADILNEKPSSVSGVDGKIVVEFEGGLYLPYDEEYSFNVVMPAAKYNDLTDLNFTIYLADNKQISGVQKVDPNNYTYLTYAPGKRFASEEYDYPKNAAPTVKASAGALGTITLKGETIIDNTPAAQIIDNADEFEAYLASIVDNTADLQEVSSVALIKKENQFVLGKTSGVASMKINAAVVELIDTYLNGGSVKFISKMQIEDAEEAVVLDKMTFNEVDVLAGDVVAEGVIAETITVKGGTLTIPADNNNAIGNIVVKAGEVIVKENYLTTANTITIGNTVVNGEVVATGKLTIDGEVKNVNLGYVTMNDGDIVIAENSSAIVGTNADDLTAGTITVDGTLEVVNQFTVQADVTVDVNGTLKTTADLTNNGTITTDKSLVVAVNNGTITPNSEKITLTVKGGNGTINNTELAKVTGAGKTTNTIYAEVPSIAFMQQANFKVGASINKIVVTGALEVETDDFELQTGITVVEFKGGSLYVAGDLTFDFNSAAVVINADTEWTGRNDIYSNHMLDIDSISVKADEDGEYYSFTYNGIAVNGVTYVANL